MCHTYKIINHIVSYLGAGVLVEDEVTVVSEKARLLEVVMVILLLAPGRPKVSSVSFRFISVTSDRSDRAVLVLSGDMFAVKLGAKTTVHGVF